MPIISFNEYKEKFERLISDENISISDIYSIVEDLIYQVPLDAMQLSQPSFLIRTSLLDKDEICSNISRCSYVPDSKKSIIPLQRCNFEFQQVFYASIPGGMKSFRDGAQPSLMETVMQKVIDEPTFDARNAAVSRWKIKRPPVFWSLPHYVDSINNNENFKFLFNQFDSFLKKNTVSNENYQNFTEKLNYLSDLFCRSYNRERAYRVTATYYDKVMKSFKPFSSSYDALIYPSANTRGEGMNIVLTKDYVDQKNIYCDLVVLYSINRNLDNAKNIWFIPTAQAIPDESGNLEFKPIENNLIE
jgi:hypothetical protein